MKGGKKDTWFIAKKVLPVMKGNRPKERLIDLVFLWFDKCPEGSAVARRALPLSDGSDRH